MSRFKERLKRIKGTDCLEPQGDSSLEDKSEPSELILRLKEKMGKISDKYALKKGKVPKNPKGKLPGDEVETDAGPVLVIEKRYPLSYRHGRYIASDFLEVGPGLTTLAGDEGLSPFRPSGALFIDTETTGLAGGTGTLPFLIGVGRFEGRREFVVKQFFCREPSEEGGQLTLLKEHLVTATSLVTFNGKAFDIPLINTRFILNRMKNPGHALPHLDLLFISRRVFKRRLRNCSLQNLESAVLGFERVGDIPGSAIPAAYRDYLRGGGVDTMESVLEHNALDLVGLAALGAALEEMYTDPAKVEHAADHLGLARAAFKSGERTAGMDHLDRAGRASSAEDSRDAYAMAAKDAAKQGEFHRAKSLWEKALEATPDDPHVHLALAKHFEHRDKDFKGALVHAAHTAEAEGEDGSSHRIARLNRKIDNRR